MVWGDIQSFAVTEFVQSCDSGIFRSWWLKIVSPYRDSVHWDLWGPAAVKSINRNFHLAARINDTTHETKLYFQEKKSQTFKSYKKDEAYIKTQTGNWIKLVCSD